MINHYHNNWCIIWIIIYITNEYIIYKTNGLQLMPGGGIFKPVRTPWGVWFLASIKCIYDNDFHLSFYFIYSTIFDIEMSHFVEFCRKLCTLYTIYIILHIEYIIILSLKSIQYFFLIHLTKYILYVLRTLFLIY